MKFKKKIFLVVTTMFLLSLSIMAKSQSFTDSISFVNKSFLANSFVFKFNTNSIQSNTPGSFISIFSKFDKVRSNRLGEVVRIKKNIGTYTVVIDCKDSIFIFANLKVVNVYLHEKVAVNELVGSADWDYEAKLFRLILSIFDKKKEISLTYFDLYDYLILD